MTKPVGKTSHLFKFTLPPGTELGPEFPKRVPGAFVKNGLIFAPPNCAWLVAETLKELGVSARFTAPAPQPRVRWADVLERVRPHLREIDPKTGTPVAEIVLPYQKEGILTVLNSARMSGHLHHPTGSGKALSAAIWLLYHQGPGIFVTKASARKTIEEEFLRYTTVKPLVLRPESDLRTGEVNLAEVLTGMLARCELPQIIIVGMERLQDWIDLILQVPYVSVAFDEIHRLSNHRRWAAVPKKEAPGENPEEIDAKPDFRRLNNVANVAARLSGNAKFRLGTTATAVSDRTRNLWAQLDLVHPWDWGTPWSFFAKYTDLTVTSYGALDNRGASNLDELRQRLDFVVHRVDSSVTRKYLPDSRRQLLLIPKSVQDKPGSFRAELERAKKQGRKSMLEVSIAEATSRKFSTLVGHVSDAVGTGSKIIIFANRHSAIERLDELFARAQPSLTRWAAHGGQTPSARDVIRGEYMSHPGPCLLLGTMGAWGESISLQDTDLAIMASVPINQKELQQTEGRVRRHGQKRKVVILYTIAEGTIDEHYNSILLSKLPAVEKLQGDSDVTEAYKDLSGFDNEEKFLDTLFEKLQTNADQEAV